MNQDTTEPQVQTEASQWDDTNVLDNAAPRTAGQAKFFDSPECGAARRSLERLVESLEHNTESSYFSGSVEKFTDRHLQYLSLHPQVNISGYLSNLRLMTRQRG